MMPHGSLNFMGKVYLVSLVNMFILILTVYLQACSTCENNSESTIMLATNDKFICHVAAKRLVEIYDVEEYGVKQYATAECEEVK